MNSVFCAASSKNGKFFVTDFFSVFYFAVKPSENDEKMSKTEFFYHTHDPRYGQKSAASAVKMGNFFVTDFFVFYFAVKPSTVENRDSFITPMTRDLDKKVLPAVKMGNFLSPIFLFFILLQNHLKMMKNVENRILLSHP